MKSKRGGSSLTQLAVPAALFYANQVFGSRRRRPVPATFRRRKTTHSRRTIKRSSKRRTKRTN